MDWVEEQFGLAGRTAVVTGARTGIGRAIAVALADAGADVVVWGRTDRVAETATAIRDRGRSAEVVVADLADLDAAQRAAEDLARQRVDIVVNNAGIIRRAPAAEGSLSDWRDVQTVNVDAMFLLCQTFGRPMLERGHGKIINIASVLSFQGGIRVAAYTTSKHAVTGLTRALANEWAGHGVNVNAIAPGYVVTDNTAALRADPDREPQIRARIPAGRWATVDDLTGAAVFLASRASDYVHGHVLAVDGGWLSR